MQLDAVDKLAVKGTLSIVLLRKRSLGAWEPGDVPELPEDCRTRT